MRNNTSGFSNVAVGPFAGDNVTTADTVICLLSAGENVSGTTWIENIYGVTTVSGTTAPVVVSDGGQLGTVASSERFKKDITGMEKASEAILSLRPVTFHYKTDTKGTSQFGLIAEEVAKVNPALVLPDKEGKPYTVRYDAVNAMLLNEFLKEHRTVQELKSVVARQEAAAAQQQKQIEALTAGLQKVNAELEASKPAPQVVNNP
jgi:predicted ribosome quality control (RQC) complex YloA/Tae2 family protein